jgi:hypothetical protein
MNNNNEYSKNNILDKDGLPLAWFCGYLKINNNDLDKIKLLLKENNIPFKYEYKASVFGIEDIAQHRILDIILDFSDNLNNISANDEKEIVDCIDNLDLINNIKKEEFIKEEETAFSKFIDSIELIVDTIALNVIKPVSEFYQYMKGK